MANEIKEKENSGNMCMQNQHGNLFGFTTPSDGKVGDPTNITMSSRAKIKVASDENMEMISEESIIQTCKNTIYLTGKKLMHQARGEFAVEVGDEVKFGLFHMKGPEIKIESGGNSILSGKANLTLKRDIFSIVISATSIKISSPGASLTVDATSCKMVSGGNILTCGPGGCNLGGNVLINGEIPVTV